MTPVKPPAASPPRRRVGLRWAPLAGAVALAALVGPSQAREFGDHERPWARDMADGVGAMSGQCPTATEMAALSMVRTGLAPSLDGRFTAGERALALASARSARLDAQAADIEAARLEVVRAAAEVQAQMQALETLKASVRMEIERLEGAEDAAETRRVDLLRALRPRDAAATLADASTAEKARLLGVMQPREAAAILAAWPEAEQQAVFTAMRAGEAEASSSAGEP